jgi:PAS domain S-box-containing protein
VSAFPPVDDRSGVEEELRESRDQLSVILRRVADGITVQDPEGHLVYANDSAAHQIGFPTAEEFLAAPIAEVLARFDVLDEAGEPLPLMELPGRLALQGIESERTVGYRIRATGELRWSIVRASPVYDEDGSVRFAINVFHDVTDHKRAEDRNRFLAEAGELLSSSLDYESTLAQVARLAVPRLGDWCMVYMRAEDGSIERLAVEHAGGRHHDVLARLRNVPFDPDATIGVPAVLRTGEPQLHSDADSALVASDVMDPAPIAAQLEELGIRSWMCVPLDLRGRTIGAISVLSAESGRRFDESDLALTQELARRAALAVENARLYRQAHETAATLDTLVATAPVGLGFWDRDFRYLRINDALAEINGVSREEHLGRTVREVLPELAPTLEPLWRRVLETGEPMIGIEITGETPARPGVTRSWLATYYPVTNASGERIGVGAIISDITERKRAEEEAEAARTRVDLLAEAGELLASAVSYQEAVSRVPAIVVPRIADACSVFVAEDDDAMLVRLGSAHANPELAAVLASLPARYDVTSESHLPITRAFVTREPALLSQVPPEFASEAARDEEERTLLESLATRSAMVLPLVAGDRCFGVLTLSSLQPDRHREADFELAKELARRLAVALDRARLYKEALESYALLEGLLASAPVGIGFWDRDLRFVRVNEALAAINGIPPEEHIGRTLAEILPELAPQLEPIYRRVLETGVPLIHEETTAETPTRPGGLRHWLTSYYPVVAEDGVALGMAAVIMEITEQKRAEEALHRSEERFRSLVTASTNIVWTTDASGAMVEASRSWEAFTGQRREEYTAPGWGWLDALHPDDREPAAQRWRSAIEVAEPVETSYRLRRQDGEYRRMAVSAIPILGPDGALREWVGTSTDVEEEQRARTAVEDARERLSFLADASRQLAASLDYERTLETVTNLPVGRIAEWASVILFEAGGAVRRVAHAHVEPEGDRLLDLLWQRYPLRLDDENPAGPPLRAGETVFLPEITEASLATHARDEEHLELLLRLGYASSIAVPFVVGGHAVGALTLVRSKESAPYTQDDVELAEELARRAAIALDNARLFREAEDRARAAQALEFVGDGVFLVDREGLIRIWNPAAATITGLDADVVLGRSAVEAIPGWGGCVGRVPIADSLSGASARPETLPLEIGGRELWVSISGVGFGEGTVFAFRDVTGERGVEKMKSDFVSTVSHELRTPLAAIYGAAVTLRRPDMPVESDSRDELLGVISSEAERLARIVNDILWTSRIESGGLQVTIERCDPVELAADIVQAQRLRLPENVTLDLVSANGLSELAADPDKVRQVLANLVDNAVKYSPDGGRVEVRLERGEERVRFLVADEGLGIPPAEHERIFEKFYRLDPNLTRGVGGTGLGLYICRELVRRMNGRIWVETRDGRGSLFVVELPLAPWPT